VIVEVSAVAVGGRAARVLDQHIVRILPGVPGPAQVGNAVPPFLALQMADVIAEFMSKNGNSKRTESL